MSTLTKAQQDSIAQYLEGRPIAKGIGTAESACSIAAINLALTGELTDKVPPCMSPVIGNWIISTQDALPHDVRNSAEWRRLLPLAAGTGQQHEQARIAMILDWMWTDVLPQLQERANERGFGAEWAAMCEQRTAATARAAAFAAAATFAAAAATYAAATYDAYVYACACADAAAAAAAAAAFAARADAFAARADATFWQNANPCGLLARLIAVSE